MMGSENPMIQVKPKKNMSNQNLFEQMDGQFTTSLGN